MVLGVSGGADSVCLLFVLLELQEILGISLHVVHVNHGVREDAGEDAAYVEALCSKYSIPFMLEEIRLEALAGQLRVSAEEAGRIARYKAFEKACSIYGCNKIAVAHNSNDRAETMLFHLFRGTGLKGMAGIRPVREHIVRPLLCLERREIEAYLEARGILFKQDSTNAEDDYTRNRIRHHILPYAQENVSEGCIGNMCRSADIFAEEEEYLEEQTRAAQAACVVQTGLNFQISVEGFLQQHPVIQKRLIMMLLKELSPGQRDIAAVHISDILTLFIKEGNRQIHLPYGIRGERSYDRVWLERKADGQAPQTDAGTSGNGTAAVKAKLPIQVKLKGDLGGEQAIILPDGSKLLFKILENGKNTGENYVFSENRYTKWFDYDTIFKPLRVRTRQTGDYLTIRGKTDLCHKKLKDYMVTEKIPQDTRDKIFVIAEENHVLWLAGYRISEQYKVTINTKTILQVQWVR